MIATKTRFWVLGASLLLLMVLMTGCGGSAAAALTGASWPGITVYDGLIYMAAGPQVFALEPGERGTVTVWSFPEEASRTSLIFAAPAVDESLVVVASYDGKVYALDPNTGAARWSVESTSNRFIGSAALSADRVYIAGTNGTLYALDRDTGSEDWRFTAERDFWSTPLIVEDRLYITSLDRHLYALDLATGDLLWKFPEDGVEEDGPPAAAMLGTPTLLGETLYFSSFNNRLYALDIATQEVKWTYTAANWMWNSPAYDEKSGLLIGGDLDGHVFALDPETGEEVWTFDANGPVVGSPLFVDRDGQRVVMFTSGNQGGDSNFYILKAEDGSQADAPLSIKNDFSTRFLFIPTGTDNRSIPIYGAPVLMDDLILVGAHQGDFTLFALDAETLLVRWKCNPVTGTCS
ncbi:MAG: hypothetical protein Kow00124_03810 [Anaerolineae bacterium]